MRNQFLFVWAPRLALASAILALVVQGWKTARARIGIESDWEAEYRPQGGLAAASWRLSIVLVAAGHVIATASPGLMLVWNREFGRLFALEFMGWFAGATAVGSFIVMAARQRYAPDGRGSSPTGVIAATLVLVALVSGLASAVVYRWASYWSAVTLTPYLHSVLWTHASPALVASMPALVKLHVFSAFGSVALVPWTAASRELIAALVSRARAAAMRPAWRPAEDLVAASPRPALSTGDSDRAPFTGDRV